MQPLSGESVQKAPRQAVSVSISADTENGAAARASASRPKDRPSSQENHPEIARRGQIAARQCAGGGELPAGAARGGRRRVTGRVLDQNGTPSAKVGRALGV
jgi:phage tail tape-measure protein